MACQRWLVRSAILSFCFVLAVFFCWSCGGGSTAKSQSQSPPPTFDLVQVANGSSNPLDIQQPDDNSGRLFVVEQGGHIQIIQSDGTRASTPFLDVTGRPGFTSGGETGLIG